jgi:type I site-specific restriction endonuclease
VTEADTCRKYVVPKLVAAGWENEPHSIEEVEQEPTEGTEIKEGEVLADGEPPERRKYYFDQGSVEIAAHLVYELALQAGHPESDPLDLLCHLAFNAPLRTRRERADRLKREAKAFFDKFGPEARAVLNDLLDKYTEHGATQFQFPDVLQIPPLSAHGSVREIASFFGGPEQLRTAVNQLQSMLYAA